MISFKFNLQKGILESTFVGEINQDEIIDYILSIKESRSFPRVLKILTDATDARLHAPRESVAAIVEETNKFVERFDMVSDAMVISTPRETAISLLYQESVKSTHYQFKAFSTREAALEWLDAF